jgi:3-hydroxyacyl-CoA dehydrogenase
MGSRIAAHMANAGVPSLLLDVLLESDADGSGAAKRGLERAACGRPPAFFLPEGRQLVRTGNFEDHLSGIADCDWIIEVVAEDLAIKRELLAKVTQVRRAGSIVSTNTSGIPIRLLCEGWTAETRQHFLGTHFFNPPRYLHLVEIIPGDDTSPDVVDDVAEFCERRLGKGVVRCKDTPNFIANRIGSFLGCTVANLTGEEDYSVEEADELTGPLAGLPSTASYRLIDLIGLDIWLNMTNHLHEAVPHDPWRERLVPAGFLDEMARRGWLGDKAGQGFYKRVGKGREIWVVDWRTLEYRPAQRPDFPSLDTARAIEDLGGRLRYLVAQHDRAGNFLWKLFRDVLLYSASLVPEISDRVVEIDRAMRWGYGHAMGPFELWDALGFRKTVERMERDRLELPETVRRMLSRGAERFYEVEQREGAAVKSYFDLARGEARELETCPGVLLVDDLRRVRGAVCENAGASLIDMGDGVLLLELHGPNHRLGQDQLEMIHSGLEEAENNYDAMVIGGRGDHFSDGANLVMILLAAQDGEWDEIDGLLRLFQEANLVIRHAARPVVAAPRGRTLGAGCEMVLHAARVQTLAELSMGFPEAGLGLIPAGGGCTELIQRLRDPEKAFELIGRSRISSCAADAIRLGLLGARAEVTMNPERLLGDAKALALCAARTFVPAIPAEDVEVGGEAVFARLKLRGWLDRQAGRLTEHDFLVAEKLAGVISGGTQGARRRVSPEHLLDLEREAYLSLCGTAATQERIRHLLVTGKPLRN